MIKYLLGKATTGKFRFAVVECDEEWHEPEHGYIIQRSYGQVNGKTTLSPKIIVDKTKQKRNWKEQYTLQFNSEVKKFLDKGYVEVLKHPNNYSETELSEIFGEVATNQAGIIKPMLAKQESKLTNRKILDKEWLCSRKLDGVRCLMYWDGKQVRTASRGGENYDPATSHLRENEQLIEFFESHPSIILDGELYRHGKTLQQISGAARMEKNAYDCDWLQYWIYDMYDVTNSDMIADERQNFILVELNFPVYHNNDINSKEFDTWELNSMSIIILNQVKISGEENIWKLHDQYIEEGFEGCVIRNPNKPYKPNGRTNDMIKFKNYKSEDFKVIGYELGRRGSEDMCFICKLEDGRTFKAMPCGTREDKEEYISNFDVKYKNHFAECTYFNYSNDGIPTQPKMRVFRFDLE